MWGCEACIQKKIKYERIMRNEVHSLRMHCCVNDSHILKNMPLCHATVVVLAIVNCTQFLRKISFPRKKNMKMKTQRVNENLKHDHLKRLRLKYKRDKSANLVEKSYRYTRFLPFF